MCCSDHCRCNEKEKRKIWVKKWLLARENKSVYNNLFQELRVDDAESYRRYLRMNTDTLQELLQSVTPKLEKRGTTMRKPLSVGKKIYARFVFLPLARLFLVCNINFAFPNPRFHYLYRKFAKLYIIHLKRNI